jgi:hypothetical protein
MSRESFTYTHGDAGSAPGSSLDFSQNQRPDAQNFDWWWSTVIGAINGHASEFGRLDSDDDGVVDAADGAASWSDSGTSLVTHPTDINITGDLNLTDDGDGTVSLGASTYSDSQARTAVDGANVSITGDADTVDGNHASAFADSGHVHDSRYDDYGHWTIEEGDGEQTNVHSNQKLEIYGGNDLNTEITSTGSESRLRISHNNTGGTSDINTDGATIIDALKTDGNGHVTNAWTRNLNYGDLGGNFDAVPFNNIEDVGSLELGIDQSEGFLGDWGNGTAVLWDSRNVSTDANLYVNGGTGASSTPTIGVNENNIDAGSVDGYDVQKNGSDTSGVINFKT